MNNDKNWMKEGSAPQDFTISGSANLPTTSLQEERNIEPWLSIEGVLWDVRGGVTLVEEGMKLIRGYLETTTPPQPDQFSQVAKKVPEPWVREFQTVCEEISVRYDEPVYGHAIIEFFIQKTLEADRKEREAEIVAGIEGMKAWTVDYLVDGNRRDDLIAKNELIAKTTKGEI